MRYVLYVEQIKKKGEWASEEWKKMVKAKKNFTVPALGKQVFFKVTLTLAEIRRIKGSVSKKS